MIQYFTGTARAENKERCRKYFVQHDVNGDGVLQRNEVDEAIASICKALLLTPPGREKVDALVAKTDKNGDGVLSTDEWMLLYSLLVKSALQQASMVIERQHTEMAAASARAREAAVAAREAERASAAASELKASAKGQGPKIKVKTHPKPPGPAKTKGQLISAWTTDTRGAACAFRYACATCQHKWHGMGLQLPTSTTCPGCSQTGPVTDHGWG